MASRLYYDPRNPRMLSRQEVTSLSSTEAADASEQLDQLLVSVLQDIDENFVRATRIITERILPALEAYGEASRDIWQSVKFWQTFFEAAAGLRLTGGQEGGDTTTSSHDATLQPGSPAADQTATDDRAFANEPSDLEILQEQIREQFGLDGGRPIQPPSMRMLPPDSPGDGDLLQPELETLSLGELPGTRRRSNSKGKGRASDPRILQQILIKNLSSTPARPSSSKHAFAVPPEAADPKWSGLSDLGRTPLSAFSPSKPRKSEEVNDSLDIDLRPPSLHHFSVPRSRAALARTPAKEAARLVARDALEAAAVRSGIALPAASSSTFTAAVEASPIIEPPSVLRNWATRGYGDAYGTQDDEYEAPPSPSAGRQPSQQLVQDESVDLADDSLIVDGPGWDAQFEQEGEASIDEGDYDDTVEEGSMMADFAPTAEDTLFGGRRATLARPSGDFKLRGMQGDEMATLHGGQLADAQPFQRSPLAGRDAKYGL